MYPDDNQALFGSGASGAGSQAKALALLSDLKARGKLPALDANVGNICSLTNDPATCVGDLTSVILRDCALTSAVISAANSVVYAQGEPIKTVSAAIVLLGFEKIKSLALGLVLIKQLSQNAQDRNLYRLFACSYFGGLFAMSLGRMIGNKNPEELLVGGILNTLPRLLLANGYPERYAAMEKKVVTEKITTSQACIQEFGVSYETLTAEVIRYWNMPESFARFVGAKAKQDKDSIFISEGTQIADMMFGSVPGGSAALAKAESRLKQTLAKEDFSITSFISNSCDEDANVKRFFKLNVKDVDMMVKIVEWGKVDSAQVAASLTYGAANEALQQPQQDPSQMMGQYLTDLSLAMRKTVDINRVLLTSLEAIYRCVRPDLVMVVFINKQDQLLEGRYLICSSNTARPRDFRVPTNDFKAPINRCMLTKETQTAVVESEFPLPFFKNLKIQLVRLVPIVVMDNSVGVFVLGREKLDPYTEQEATWLEAITNNVSMGFERARASLNSQPAGGNVRTA